MMGLTEHLNIAPLESFWRRKQKGIPDRLLDMDMTAAILFCMLGYLGKS